MRDILIGVDLGTSALKVAAFDRGGRLLSSASRGYALDSPHPGWAEQDPEQWWKAARGTLLAAMRGVDPRRVAGISFSGQMHGAVFLDESRRVIRPCMLWCDGRTGPQCERIVQRIGRAKLLATIKNLPLASYTLPKLLWLAQHEPAHMAALRTLLLPKDFLRLRLTGEAAIDHSDASGTAMLDAARGNWAEGLVRALGLDPAVLPPLVLSTAPVGAITREAARVTGLPEGLPVVAGGADQPVGALGVGVIEQGQAMLSLGTSGVVFAPTNRCHAAGRSGLASFAHVVPRASYLMGCVLSAGGALRWHRDTLCRAEAREARRAGREIYDDLIDAASQTPPGAEGLLFLPYLMGERTPHADPTARGAFVGLSGRHTLAHLTRAVLEGVAFALRDALEAIRAEGIVVAELRAIGGGARSRIWLQTIADVCATPIRPMKDSAGAAEVAAFGAAMLAGVGVGAWSDCAAAARRVVRAGRPLRPDPRRCALYEHHYQRYQALYPAIRNSFQAGG